MLSARAEILKKNLVGFFVQTMTPKSPFEINWPLEGQAIEQYYWDFSLSNLLLSLEPINETGFKFLYLYDLKNLL